MTEKRHGVFLERLNQLEDRIDIIDGKLDTLMGMIEQLLESSGRFQSVHDAFTAVNDGEHFEGDGGMGGEQRSKSAGLSEKQREVLLSRRSVREKASELGMSIGWVSKWTNRLREDLAQSRQLDFL